MATKGAHRRLMKEYASMQTSPPPFITAKPTEKNILEWYYVITGPPDSPYADGEYLGKIVFPSDYPFKPPSIQMITPNGRFKPSTRLCLTMSDFHPESWNPSWSVASILTGLLSFMLEDTSTTGSISTSHEDKRALAAASRRWNRESNPKFREHFPDLAAQPATTQQETVPSSPVKKSRDILDNDVAWNEVRHFFTGGGVFMLVGGLVLYYSVELDCAESSGVGYGLAERFLANGEEITLIFGCRNEERALKAMAELRAKYPNSPASLEFIQMDLTKAASILSAVEVFHAKFRTLDLLYCNAGILPVAGVDYLKGTLAMLKDPVNFFQDTGATLIQSVGQKADGVGMVFMANVFGHYILIRGLERAFSQHTRIIWTGSATSTPELFSWVDVEGLKNESPYESSKYATELLSSGLNEFYTNGVTSYIADPGTVSTSILNERIPWVVRTLLIVPVIYFASLFLDFITFYSWQASVSLFFLSGVANAIQVKQVDEQLDINKPDPSFKYCARYSTFKRSEYVEQVYPQIPKGAGMRILDIMEEMRLRIAEREV